MPPVGEAFAPNLPLRFRKVAAEAVPPTPNPVFSIRQGRGESRSYNKDAEMNFGLQRVPRLKEPLVALGIPKASLAVPESLQTLPQDPLRRGSLQAPGSFRGKS